MITWSVGLFALAALGGITLLALRLRDADGVPLGLAVVHGLAAASALVLLLIVVFDGGAGGLAVAALVAFVVAALVGFYLFASHFRTGTFAVPPAVAHALVAAVGFVMLVIWVVG